MVEHSQQIRNIIEGLTSYLGHYYPKSPHITGVDEALPRFFVKDIEDRFNNNGVQQSEFFSIELEADSLANLETQIKDILGLSTNGSAGWNLSTSVLSYTVKINSYTDDISRNVDDEAGTILAGDHGRIAQDVV